MFEHLLKYPMSLYREGVVRFTGPAQLPLELRLLGVIVLAVLVVWLYRRTLRQVGRLRRWGLTVLRVVVLALLLFIIFPPVLLTKDVRVRDRFVAVLVDDSRSMTIPDAAEGASRLESARKILFGGERSGSGGVGGVLDGVRGLCGVRVFRFADRLERLASPDDLKGQGHVTDLFTALKGVDEQLRGVPLAAVVLLTDGNHNTLGDPLNAAMLMTAKRVPVFTVGLGDLTPPPDLEVVSADAPKKVRRKASAEVVVTVRSHGYTQPYTVLLRQDEDVVSKAEVTPRSVSDIQRVTFSVFLDRDGTCVYRVEIPPAENEKIVNNNRRELQVEVEETRLPVLYVEGSPRTEFRFLRGALFEDTDFRIVSILRLGENRFLVQGSEADTELKDGFPRTKDKLFSYEAVIFGDIEASFFTKEQLAMVEAFVSERGGGFLMLGGVNSLNLGGYEGTPVAKMLPVVLSEPTTPYDKRQFRIQVSEGGVTHPIMHQTSDPLANVNVWNSVSPLLGHNLVRGLKPGAVPLMESVLGREPVLAVQDYGIGRTAVFTTGGSWFWQMNRPVGDGLHQRFWKQLVRWLAMGSKPKLSIDLKTLYSSGEPVRVSVKLLGRSLEPVNDAAVRARVEDPFGHADVIPLEWILSEDGVYQGTYVPRDQGEHKVAVTAQYAGAEDKLELQTSFLVGESYVEFSPGWQNALFLRELSARTGGAYYDGTDVSRMVADLGEQVRESAGRRPEVTRHDLWDMPVLFLVVFLALSTEWFIKRRTGLP
ncbi:MAG TPA: glutamine amidotransferase [Planctomycetota bacterium]|nr:glutamine amidotransferase [Planctomycetota bacterium]